MSLQERGDQLSPTSDQLRAADKENDSVASKLSQELSNWRRKRTQGRPHPNEAQNFKFQSDAARTIKVRGHETLVVRKSKSAGKPTPHDSNRTDS